MSEFPNDKMDSETKERMKEAWSGLALGYIAHTRRVGLSSFNPIFALNLVWRENRFKASVFGYSYTPSRDFPTNLQMLLTKNDNIELVSGAKLEWKDLKPIVLECFGFNTIEPNITPEHYLSLINIIGAHLEQPHNSV